MAELTKRSHYLPASYLQFFSANPCGRKSIVYLYDGTKSVSVRVDQQCIEWYYYAKDPEANQKAEEWFNESFEGCYPVIVRKILDGASLDFEERIELFRFMLHINLRGPTYDNNSSSDRFKSFSDAFNSLGIVMGRFSKDELRNPDRCIETIRNSYDVRVFYSASPNIMLSSDNPCVIYNHKRPDFDEEFIASVLVLPIDPHHFAVAADNRLFQFTSHHATAKDSQAVTTAVTHNRVQNLYCHGDLQQIVSGPLPSVGTRGDGQFTDDKIVIRFDTYPNHFSFLESLPTCALDERSCNLLPVTKALATLCLR